MNYHHASGSEKRKCKKKLEEEANKHRNALLKYFIHTKVDNINVEVEPEEKDVGEYSGNSENQEVQIEKIENNENIIEVVEMKNIEAKNIPEVEKKNENAINEVEIQNIEGRSNTVNNILVFDNLDISLWPLNLTTDMQHYLLKNKPSSNISLVHTAKKVVTEGGKTVTRTLKKYIFTRNKANGEKIKREWLVYSPRSKAIYCYVCKIFAIKRTIFTEGFSDWKNVSVRVKKHERSTDHRHSIEILIGRNSVEGRIDTIVEKSGNYIGALEYLAEFDEFLASHIKQYGSAGKGNVSYLSSTICDEFIEILNKKMLETFVTEVKAAKYFSIIIDSTPDITHVDQLTFILRYLLEDGTPIEKFFGFIPIYSHSGESLENELLQNIAKFGLDISNCKGQSYDNAANMSGKYNGLQNRIKRHSETAHYVPCASHSLNLVINSASESCLQAITYFNLLEIIYTFFSASTYRWNILEKAFATNNKHFTVKKLCITRWSCRADAVKAIRFGFDQIKRALLEISLEESQKCSVKEESRKIANKMNTLEFILLTVIWDKILSRINASSQSLQNPTLPLSFAVNIFDNLYDYVNSLRSSFLEIEAEALSTSEIKVYCDFGKRSQKRKRFFDDAYNDEGNVSFCQSQEMFKRNCFYVICDKISLELKVRSKSYKDIDEIFKTLHTNIADDEDVSINTALLKKWYSGDIDTEELDEELLQFKLICKSQNLTLPSDMLQFIKSTKIVSTFPNTEILLRIYLTLPISNASGERSFSVLKRVKNYLRNSLNESKLNSLAVLYIEQNALDNINYDEIIDNFAELKTRKQNF
ncbi:zinc finger MYM-type protein 1-like [Centruroides vittatus]|uniref:zinc finger MYM-type protein 1-like n=1 Tax=Centruroides vittatus TaxID=120091 RepID=UPI00350EF455